MLLHDGNLLHVMDSGMVLPSLWLSNIAPQYHRRGAILFQFHDKPTIPPDPNTDIYLCSEPAQPDQINKRRSHITGACGTGRGPCWVKGAASSLARGGNLGANLGDHIHRRLKYIWFVPLLVNVLRFKYFALICQVFIHSWNLGLPISSKLQLLPSILLFIGPESDHWLCLSPKAKLLFRLWAQGLVKILKLKFVQHFAADVL